MRYIIILLLLCESAYAYPMDIREQRAIVRNGENIEECEKRHGLELCDAHRAALRRAWSKEGLDSAYNRPKPQRPDKVCHGLVCIGKK